MPAKLTLHPPQRASRFLVVRDGESLLVGRGADCGLVLEDLRVSKRHARLHWVGSGWLLEDLQSKNGTSVNGAPASGQDLASGDWVSFGGIPGRFERLSEEAVRHIEAERLGRLHTSAQLRRRLSADLEPLDLVLRFLESAIELARAERGFVLVAGPDGALRVEAEAGFSPQDVSDDGFAGSVGAVERAVATGASIVVQDLQADAVLGQRPSVVAKGLGALACVPLRHEGRLIGLLYLDSRRPGTAFTALDLEILEALAEHTAVLIASLRLEHRIRGLMEPALPTQPDQPVLDALRTRIGGVVSAPDHRGAPSPPAC